MIVKFSRGLVLIAAIPVLAACGNSGKTSQIALSNVATPPPASTSHAPTTSSSKPATATSSKAPTSAVPAPVATPHASAAPVVTPAHSAAPAQNTPAQKAAPASQPAATPSATHPVTQPAVTPSHTSATPQAHSTASAVAPTHGKAPVIATPNPGTTKATQTTKTPFTAALVNQNGKGIASPSKHLNDGTWRVYVTGITSSTVTVQVLEHTTGRCTDDCLVPVATQTIPLASVNVSTVLPVKNPTSTNKGFPGVTAPAWAYTEIFNQGQTGLNKVVADPKYTISSDLKARIDPAFATTSTGTKSVYSDITIKNGVVTGLQWTWHP